MRVKIVVQARTDSSRLPGKAFLELGKRPIILFLIDRLVSSKYSNHVVLATSDREIDDELADLVKSHGVEVFRGDIDDVFSRFLAVSQNCDYVVRLTGDNPLVDGALVDLMIETAVSKEVDYCSNICCQTPYGLFVEVVKSGVLNHIKDRLSGLDREHVTTYLRRNSAMISTFYVDYLDYSAYPKDVKLSVDTLNDYLKIRWYVNNAGFC